jgi:hypothetical protein
LSRFLPSSTPLLIIHIYFGLTSPLFCLPPILSISCLPSLGIGHPNSVQKSEIPC